MKILQMIFLVLMISHKVMTNRLVENTTCLELAKPSNQQLRLTCSHYDYHCLLDETFTKEFEACREWKWIPGGKCAYFNTYGNGNVDERECKPGTNLTCSESNRQFESYKNTQFSACYKEKNIAPSIFTTTRTSIQVTSNWTTYGDDETPSTFEIRTVLPIVYGIIVPFLSVSLIWIICMRLKATKKGRKRDVEILSMPTAGSDHVKSKNGVEMDEDSTDEYHEVKEVLSTSRESSIKGKIDNNSELHPLLGNHLADNLKNPLTIKRKDEDNTPEEQKEDEEKPNKNTAGSDKIKSDVEEEKTTDSTDELIWVDENIPKECTPEEHKGDEEKSVKNTAGLDAVQSDVKEEKTKDLTDELNEVDQKIQKVSDPMIPERKEENEENETEIFHQASENTPAEKSDNEKENEEESDVFNDTIGSLTIAPIADEIAREKCRTMFNLLENGGLNLSQKVMAAIIIKKTGKPVESLSNNKTFEKEGKLKEELPEHRTSFYVSYHLHQNVLDKKHHPKSGWGNPIRGIDIGIGDDVERLNRIHTIVCGISNPMTVSVEDYIRLLDIMIEALTRLDPDAEFEEDLNQLSYKLESIKTPYFTQRMRKKIGNFFENMEG